MTKKENFSLGYERRNALTTCEIASQRNRTAQALRVWASKGCRPACPLVIPKLQGEQV